MIASFRSSLTRKNAFTAIAFVCASVSGVAIILHALGWLPMYFLIDILAVPALAILIILGVWAKRVQEQVFLNRLIVGFWAGWLATFAYDGIRYLLWVTNLIGFDPFKTHPIFGWMITGMPIESSTAIIAGWAYHFWNGFGFAIMYTLLLGPAHWLYAVGWALFLEIAWLTALPSAANLTLNPDLIVVSIIGHTAYGVVLGLLAKRYIHE